MGSQLTKNYDVDKEPYMHGGMHNMWNVYRAKRKVGVGGSGTGDVSIFMFEKKIAKVKGQTLKPEVFDVLKKDAANLVKFRHPGILNLIEPLMEDAKMIAFVSEPVEYNLAALAFDSSLRDQIPSEVDLKC